MSEGGGMGKARIAMYLEDLGEATLAPQSRIPGQVTAIRTTEPVAAQPVAEKTEAEYQVLWELEVWK